MIKQLRTWLARRLDPDTAHDAERYWYLWHQLDDAHKWLSYEFNEVGDVLLWLKMKDQDHWRSIGTPGRNPWPSGISDFRERLRRARTSIPR